MEPRRDNDPAKAAPDQDPDVVAADGSLGDAGVGQPDGGDQDATSGAKDVPSPPDVVADLPPKGCAADEDCSGLALVACHAAVCELATGLCQIAPLPDDTTCTTSAPPACTEQAICQQGACVVIPKDCDDGNPCTDDACDVSTGCKQAFNAGWCTDGNACTYADTCSTGQCVGKPLSCDDGEPCTQDACDPETGCSHLPEPVSSTCDDGLSCTDGDLCGPAGCKGTPKDCDDGKPCTDDFCLEKAIGNQLAKGCNNPASTEPFACDDGDPCTVGDLCADGACKAGTGQPDCDDDNPCTDDTCEKSKGCVSAANTAPCGGDLCTGLGTCQDGACQGGAAKSCDDGNACTEDACDPKTGCKHGAKDGAPCGDGDVCTADDQCQGGSCQAGPPIGCDDGDACTSSQCDPVSGCVHTPLATGKDCGAGQCVAGLCLADGCGDGLCSLGDLTASCSQDCPEQGGFCGPKDPVCLETCTDTKCKQPVDACDADAGCQALAGCLAACGGQIACEHGCFQKASAQAAYRFVARNQCVQAFCVDGDYWLGQKCKGAGLAYVACVNACEPAMCKVIWTACNASPGCVAIRDCLKGCSSGDSACLGQCKAKGSAEEAELNGDLDACSAAFCL